MTNSLNEVLLSLSNEESISLEDALNALFIYINRYQLIFDKMLKIKMELPVKEGEKSFRRTQFTSGNEYQEIQRLLQKFQGYLIKFDRELARIQRHPEYTPEYQKKLLTNLDIFIASLQKLYQGKSTSFAAVLNDILALQNLFLQKFSSVYALETPSQQTSPTTNDKQAHHVENEKYVYVRIFHRLMSTLTTKQGNYAWVKPLLESVKHPEKHGFGVYANEDDVKKSLKDEHYGYVTLRINEEQDISHQRPEKNCPIVGCSLLTINNIEIDNMIRLTHQDISFDIKNGVLYR